MKMSGGFAYLTAAEMADADRLAIEGFGMEVSALMENAGAKAAELARRLLGGDLTGKKVDVLVGRGNNGGDGLVTARHLHNWGGEVIGMLGEARDALREAPARQLETVEKTGIEVGGPERDFEGADIVVDALLGYSSKGDPREPLGGLIRRVNSSRVPILAVDVPSGLDSTTGEPGVPCVAARTTVTFGLPKTGFLEPRARELVGDLYVADISLPKAVYERYSAWGMFSESSLIRVW